MIITIFKSIDLKINITTSETFTGFLYIILKGNDIYCCHKNY